MSVHIIPGWHRYSKYSSLDMMPVPAYDDQVANVPDNSKRTRKSTELNYSTLV